jgi:hypothetical protein
MSNTEKLGNVEDVLSSIRRLVADGEGPAPEQPQDTTPIILKEVDIIVVKPTESASPQVESKKISTEPTKRSASFVETMNASIAKITKETQLEDTSALDTAEQDAQLGAFLDRATENALGYDETVQLVEIDEPVEMAEVRVSNAITETEEPAAVILTKPEPYILHSAIATEPEFAEEVPDNPTTQCAASIDEEDTPLEPVSSLQITHEEEAEEITIPEDIEDDEAAMVREIDVTDQPGTHLIDEDALREIVSELVRAELQGDLGDRITHNVRKLVRREIHSALANRELE